MTTPRVTVPEAIEALKHCVENEKAHWSLTEICDPCVDVPVKYLRAAIEHLSAAPAPSSLAGGDREDAVAKVILDETQAVLDIAAGYIPDHAARHIAGRILAALSSEAPSRDGVKGPGGYLVKDFADGWYWTPNAALDHAGGAPVWSVSDARYETDPPALTPRHEAPAEGAGERLRLAAESAVETMVWLWINHVSGPPAERLAIAYADLRDALRAQPQSREDAQPVGWLRAVDEEMVCAHLGVADAEDSFETAKKKLASLIQWNIAVATDPSVGGHPAPDALRVAVEALKPFARAAEKLDGLWSEDDWRWNDSVRSGVTVRDIRRTVQALAALQAEQGAK